MRRGAPDSYEDVGTGPSRPRRGRNLTESSVGLALGFRRLSIIDLSPAGQGHYLPDDLLAKVDRASMAVSLEARVPLLDHRVVEFRWRLPLRYKVRGKAGKWLLKEVLYRHVPRELVERPKVGFSVPIAEWLRGPLTPWAEHLFSTISQDEGEVLSAGVVREAWAGLRSGARPTGLALWAVLGFLAWRERWSPTT